jgi:carboxyl-terminal processing protease
MRKLSYLFLGVALGAGSVAVATQTRLLTGGSAVAAASDTYRKLNLFGDIFERVRADYVEPPNEAKLIESAINGMLTSLDPHSSYMDPKSFTEMRQQTRGEFGGLGIEVTMEEGLIKVVSPIEDTPAAKAGILSGDIITHIDDEQVQGLSLNQAVDKMRGPINTAVRLKVIRATSRQTQEIRIVRDRIQIRAVRWRKEGEDLGYVRINSFNEQTMQNLVRGIEATTAEIGADKIKGYILDLRNNPGGLLDQAVSVSDAFLERGEIVSTRGRQVEETQRFSAKPGDLTRGKPVIVLINGGSASASEIVAGALQDHKRATIIGTRSFGKGSVQTIIPLREQGAIRLTTARYYTPSGRSIQARGIDPDIIVQQDIPEELRGRDETRGEAGLRGHLRSQGDEEKGGSSAYVPPDVTKDKQLIYAAALLRGEPPPFEANPAPTPAPATPAAPGAPAAPATPAPGAPPPANRN